MSSIEIGSRIKQIRNSAGLNQREFAEILETSSGYISGIESGKNMAGGDFLLRLHNKFNVNLHFLLTGIDLNLEHCLLKNEKPELNEEETELVGLFRQASELGKMVILSSARGAEKKAEITTRQVA